MMISSGFNPPKKWGGSRFKQQHQQTSVTTNIGISSTSQGSGVTPSHGYQPTRVMWERNVTPLWLEVIGISLKHKGHSDNEGIFMQFPKKLPILIDFDKYFSCLGMLNSLIWFWRLGGALSPPADLISSSQGRIQNMMGFGSSWTLNCASYHFTGPLAAQACDPENLWGRACGRAAGTQKFVGTFPCNRCFCCAA